MKFATKFYEELQKSTYIHIFPPYIFPNVEERHKSLFIYELCSEGRINIPCDHLDNEPYVIISM